MRLKRDFEKVFKQGKGLKLGCLFLKAINNNLADSRFGFSVGLKVSPKAVVRNKTRRRLREVVRLLTPKIKPGYDIVVVASPEAKDKDYQTIKETVAIILQKAGLLNQ